MESTPRIIDKDNSKLEDESNRIGSKIFDIYTSDNSPNSLIKNTDIYNETGKQIEAKFSQDFTIDLIEKYLPKDYADEVKKDKLRLIDLESNHSIDTLKQRGELSPDDIKNISIMERIYGILPDCLTVAEAHDVLLFASDGELMPTSSNMSREEKIAILQKREDIKERKLEYIYDTLAFITNGVKRNRKSFIPDRIEKKTSNKL